MRSQWRVVEDYSIYEGDIFICDTAHCEVRKTNPEKCKRYARGICHRHNNFDELLTACRMAFYYGSRGNNEITDLLEIAIAHATDEDSV